LPIYVDRNYSKGKTYLSFRRGKGGRIRLPDDPTSEEFREAYTAALMGQPAPARTGVTRAAPGSIAALMASYKQSPEWMALRDTTKAAYTTRIEVMREDHGHRTIAGLSRERIITGILQPYADRPGAALDTLKKLRILIRHAINIGWLKHDPSLGIKRPKGKEFRAWTDDELAAFERRWPLGTKQRTAYALMLYLGTARVDTHRITWRQLDDGIASYARSKTGVAVAIGITDELRKALAEWPRTHVTVINTEYGKPFTVDGYSRFMRDAIEAAGLPLDLKPHGLRKTLGRLLADSGATAHEIMATLGHTTLAEAERYTREADRRRGGRAAIQKLSDHNANRITQTASTSLGKQPKKEGNSI
jgi:integrase